MNLNSFPEIFPFDAQSLNRKSHGQLLAENVNQFGAYLTYGMRQAITNYDRVQRGIAFCAVSSVDISFRGHAEQQLHPSVNTIRLNKTQRPSAH
jgi:hypothetical protein